MGLVPQDFDKWRIQVDLKAPMGFQLALRYSESERKFYESQGLHPARWVGLGPVKMYPQLLWLTAEGVFVRVVLTSGIVTNDKSDNSCRLEIVHINELNKMFKLRKPDRPPERDGDCQCEELPKVEGKKCPTGSAR